MIKKLIKLLSHRHLPSSSFHSSHRSLLSSLSSVVTTVIVIVIVIVITAVAVKAFTGPGSNQPPSGDPAFWRLSGSNVYYNVSGGNVGIGTANPIYPFYQLANTSGWAAGIYNSASNPGHGLLIEAGSAATDYSFAVNNSARTVTYFMVKGNGQVGVGGAPTSAQFEVYNDGGIVAYFRNSAGIGVFLTSGSMTWSQNSDERLKDILGNIENANDKLAGLRTVYYKLKTDSNNVHRVGLIAQDVQAVIPEAVDVGPDGYLGLHYTDLIPFTIEAIKELNTHIEDLRAENEALKQLVCLEHPEAAVCR